MTASISIPPQNIARKTLRFRGPAVPAPAANHAKPARLISAPATISHAPGGQITLRR